MTYHTPHRHAVLSYIKEGGSKVEAARIFKVSRATLYRWLKLDDDDIAPKAPPKFRHRKIDKRALRAHVKAHPHMYLRERAAVFGVHLSSMGHALKGLKAVKKTKGDTASDVL